MNMTCYLPENVTLSRYGKRTLRIQTDHVKRTLALDDHHCSCYSDRSAHKSPSRKLKNEQTISAVDGSSMGRFVRDTRSITMICNGVFWSSWTLDGIRLSNGFDSPDLSCLNELSCVCFHPVDHLVNMYPVLPMSAHDQQISSFPNGRYVDHLQPDMLEFKLCSRMLRTEYIGRSRSRVSNTARLCPSPEQIADLPVHPPRKISRQP